MKILHFADLHLDESTWVNAHNALERILEIAQGEKPHLIVNAGDLAWRRGSLSPKVAIELRRFHVELARIAPVLVVAGNHDLAHAEGDTNIVNGALELADVLPGRLVLSSRPEIVMFGRARADDPWLRVDSPEQFGHGRESLMPIATLPYPNRQRLAAMTDQRGDLNARASAGLRAVLAALIIQADELGIGGLPLVYHGTIVGASYGSERAMLTGEDIVLDEATVPAGFAPILCGHIHRPQQIGRAWYCGSPSPLRFGEEGYEHGVMLWDSQEPEPKFIPIKPAQAMETLDFTEEKAAPHLLKCSPGAIVRVKLLLGRHLDSRVATEAMEASLREQGAAEVRFIIERESDNLAVNVTAEAMTSEVTLFDAWIDRTPEAKGKALALTAARAQVDESLAPEVLVRRGAASYELTELRISNWRSFGPGPFIVNAEALGSLVCVEGANASGKSNLMEAEAFALWGRFVRGRQSLAEAVRNGADQCSVSVEFESVGQHWRVVRHVKLRSDGTGKGDLFLQVLDGDAWLPKSGGTANETQTMIDNLVGSFELYLDTRYAAQSDIDRLLNKSAAEMKETLQAALDTEIYEAREAIAKQRAQDAERELRSLAGKVTALDQIAATMPSDDEALAAGDAVDAASLAFNAADAERERLMGVRAQTEAAHGQVAEKLIAWKKSANVAAAANRTYELAEEGVRNAQAKLDELGLAGVQDLPSLPVVSIEEVDRDLSMARERADRAKCAASAFEVALGKARHDEATARHELNARQSVLDGEHKELARDVQRHDDDIARAKRLLSATPFKEKCVEAGCGFTVGAAETIAMFPGVVAAKRERMEWLKRPDLLAKDRERLNLGTIVEATEKLWHDAKAGALAMAESERMTASRRHEVAAEHTAYAKGQKQRQAHIAASMDAQTALQVAQERRNIAAEADSHALAEHGRLGAAPDEIASYAAKEAADNALQRHLFAMHNARTMLDVCRAKVATLTERARAATQAAVDAATVRNETEGALAREARFNLLARACGKDGIPYLLLERALPALEMHANRFLGEASDLRIEIEAGRTTQAGDERSEVVIRYRNRFGVHGLSAASGMERVALGYALRAALACVQAEAHGVRVRHFVADEGWGAFDADALLAGQQMLREMAAQFGRVFFVSHVGEIRQVADTRLRVRAAEDGNWSEVVQAE